MREVVVAGVVRTPIGSFGGGLTPLSAVDLGVLSARETIRRADLDPREIDETLFGHGRQAGGGTNPGRQVSVRAGVDPKVMGLGPVPAVRKLLEVTGSTIDDFDLIELNEAFAAQYLACHRELGFDLERTNVNGGAIALGHPIRATGTRICVTLLHEMERLDVKRGLAALCVSGGLGMALSFDR